MAVYNTIIYLGYRKQNSNEEKIPQIIPNDILKLQNILILHSDGEINLRILHFDTLQIFSFNFKELSNFGGISSIQILHNNIYNGLIDILITDYKENIYLFHYSEWRKSGEEEVFIYPINRSSILPFENLTHFHSTFCTKENQISTDQSSYFNSLLFNNNNNNNNNNFNVNINSIIRDHLLLSSIDDNSNNNNHYNTNISRKTIHLYDSKIINHQENELLINIIVVQLYNTKFHEYYLEIINIKTNQMKVIKIPSLPFQSSNQTQSHHSISESYLRFIDPLTNKTTENNTNLIQNINNNNNNNITIKQNNLNINNINNYNNNNYNNYNKNEFIDDIWVVDLYNGNFCTIQAPSSLSSSTGGQVRTFEIFDNKLSNSLNEWEKMLGTSDSPIHVCSFFI